MCSLSRPHRYLCPTHMSVRFVIRANQSNVCGARRAYPNQPTKTVSGNQKIAVTDVVLTVPNETDAGLATRQNRQEPSGFAGAGTSCRAASVTCSVPLNHPRPEAILSSSSSALLTQNKAPRKSMSFMSLCQEARLWVDCRG